jgi:hypothetical protein
MVGIHTIYRIAMEEARCEAVSPGARLSLLTLRGTCPLSWVKAAHSSGHLLAIKDANEEMDLLRFWRGLKHGSLSQWRFIKDDEKHGENILYLYIQIISYRHPIVKLHCFCSVLLVFHTELGSDMLKKSAFVFDYNRFLCTQKSLFLPRFL